MTGEAVVFTNVSLISPVPLFAELLIPATAARLHVKVVAETVLEAV